MEMQNINPMDNGTILINYGIEAKKIAGCDEAIKKLVILCNQPKGTAFSQIQQFRKLVPILINYIRFQAKLIDGYTKTYDRMTDKQAEKSRKKWTQEDDELLIEIVARGDTSINEVSLIFGRTPGAISTRVSYLVGIKKISESVAGKFTGYLNGGYVEGIINGTVRK